MGKKNYKENITSAPKQGNLSTQKKQSDVELLILDEARVHCGEDYHDTNEVQRSVELELCRHD